VSVPQPTDDYQRSTGPRSDRVRQVWHARVDSRFPAIDRLAHQAYGEWLRWSFAVRSMADLASYRAFRRLDGAWLGRRPGVEPVQVRLRSLGGAAVRLRPGTSDALMVRETFRDCVHPPPPEIASRRVRVIVDLGANLGITVAHNARCFPGAQIVAVELDPENAELARRNTAPWANRITLLQGAVWTDDGEISFERERGNEFGVRVVPQGSTGAATTTRALSLETIFSHVPEGARVDYVKMDVEGVESRLLSGPAAAWLERVDAIALQVHDPYTLESCARDLQALGFTPRIDRRRRDFIVGVRI
jgi:FkbM family methyltransferase